MITMSKAMGQGTMAFGMGKQRSAPPEPLSAVWDSTSQVGVGDV